MGQEIMYKERTGVVVGAPVLCSMHQSSDWAALSSGSSIFGLFHLVNPLCPSQRRGQSRSEVVGVLPAGHLSFRLTVYSDVSGAYGSHGGCRELVSSVMAGRMEDIGHFSQGIISCCGGSGLVGQYLAREAHSLPSEQHGSGRYGRPRLLN